MTTNGHEDAPAELQNNHPRFLSKAENGLLTFALTVLLIATCLGIAFKRYNYDENQRAHSIWLASIGHRPYVDFFECHPPYFILLAPIARLFDERPYAYLTALRLFSSAGMLLFVAGMVRFGCRLGDVRWTTACLVFFLSVPAVHQFAIEFRIDAWAYAILIWAILLLSESTGLVWHKYVTVGCVTTLTCMLLCPKLLFFLVIFGFVHLLRLESSRRGKCVLVGALVVGVVLAVAGFALFLFSQGIRFERMWALLVRYHSISNHRSGYGFGLATSLGTMPVALLAVLAGVVAVGMDARNRRVWPVDLLIAVTVWLVVQAGVVSYPFKQYSAPWLLMGSLMLMSAPRLRTSPAIRLPVFLLLMGICLWNYSHNALTWVKQPHAWSHAATLQQLLDNVPPNVTVVASPPFHPMFRRDACFVWFTTVDPNGFDVDQILGELPGLSALATKQVYLEQLRESQPGLIVIDAEAYIAYPSNLFQALRQYTQEHPGDLQRIGETLVWFRGKAT